MAAPYPYTKHPVDDFRDSYDSSASDTAFGCGVIVAVVFTSFIVGTVLGFIAGRTAC